MSKKILLTVAATVVFSVSLGVFAYAQNTSKEGVIKPSAGLLTVVNVLTPEPGKQLEFYSPA